MQHNLTRILLVIELIPLTPIITNRIPKNRAIAIEIRRTDTAPHIRIPFQPVFGVFIPEVEGPVGAGGAEGAVDGVKGDGVDGVDVAGVVDGVAAVAFEGEVVALVFVVDVLDGAAAFDAADGKSRAVSEGADDARLPLEGRLDGFEEGGGVLEVDDLDPALRRADDEHLVPAHVHAVDALFALEAGDGLLLPQVPVFDHLVPGAGDEHGAAVEHEGLHAADGLVVHGDLLGGGGARSQVQHACRFVCAAAEDFLPVLQYHLTLVLSFFYISSIGLYSPDSSNNSTPAPRAQTSRGPACCHSHPPPKSAPSCPNSPRPGIRRRG